MQAFERRYRETDSLVETGCRRKEFQRMCSESLFRRAVGCLVVSLLLVAGCGPKGPLRYKVTGTVNLDGQPLETGQVLFIPSDGQGPSDACRIVTGKFEGEVAPGPKRVEITATKELPPAEPGGMPGTETLVPKQYNRESTLTAEIKAGGEPLTFDLESGSE